uniref:Poly(A) polymerase RNA-binding domain-containing protein n=1 Tax=Panagrolaimus sp. JU765 TaxID=591449 RepID=A0AC34RE68_9BILA
MLDIMAKKKAWRHLFEEVNFFSRYKHFICLLCTTESEEDHLTFGSLVESKIRHLITFFERNQCVNLCHINPKKFKPLPNCELSVPYENPVVTLWFVGLELNKQMRKNIDLTNEIQQFSDLVLKQASMTGNYKSTMIVRPFYVRGKDLKNWIPESEVTRGVKYQARKTTVQP